MKKGTSGQINVDKSKQPLINKDINNILSLLQNNILVKVVTPLGSGAKTLPNQLSKKYKTVVYNNQENVEDWYKSNPSELLILYCVGCLNSLRLLSIWKQNPRKILIVSNWNVDIFPLAPTYYVEWFISPITEVRYTKNYPDFNSSVTDIIKIVDEASNEEQILIYALGEDSINTLGEKLKDYHNVVITDTYDFHPDVTLIIDPMRHIQSTTTITGGFREPISYISQQSADVRSRINNKDKIVYRLISNDSFKQLLPLIPLKVTLVPLHYNIIDLYKLKLNPFVVLEDVYSQSEIQFYVDLFMKHGLLDISGNLTKKANFIRGLPFGLRLSILFTDWINKYGMENLYPVLALVTMIDNYDGKTPYEFLINTQNKQVFDFEIEYIDHIEKYFDRFRGRSDIETYLNLWNFMINETNRDDISISEWGDLNYINSDFLNNTNNLINSISSKLSIEKEEYETSEVLKHIVILFSNIYNDKLFKLDTDDIINAKYNNYQIDIQSINSIEEERPLYLYSIVNKTITSNYGNIKSTTISFVGDVENQAFPDSSITY